MKPMKIFAQLDAKKFASEVKFFTNAEKRAAMVERFWIYVANCIARMLATGDLTHVNKAAQAAEFCGYGPTFRRVVPAVVPFKFDKKGMAFSGSILKGKRELLEEFGKDGAQSWEHILRDALDGKDRKTSEPQVLTLEKVQKRGKTLARACFDAGLNRQECRKQLSLAFTAIYGPEVRPDIDKKKRENAPKPPSLRAVENANRREEQRELERQRVAAGA